MGKPKFSRKKYVTPSHPWQEDRIKEENELIRKYGLKNKREIWKAETALRGYRGQARTLLAKISSGEKQAKIESDQLLMHLTRMNILPPNSDLDDVLALENESILSRRLQTLTYLKGLANTPNQARQLICHGHIAIDGRRITIPSYMVTKQEENDISYSPNSILNDTMHPARPKSDYKSSIIKKQDSESKKPEKKDLKPETVEKSKVDSEKKEEVTAKDDEPKEKKSEELTKKTEEEDKTTEIPEKESTEEKPVKAEEKTENKKVKEEKEAN